MMSIHEISEILRKTSQMDLRKMSEVDLVYLTYCMHEFAAKVKPLIDKYYVEGSNNDLVDALRKAYEEEHK